MNRDILEYLKTEKITALELFDLITDLRETYTMINMIDFLDNVVFLVERGYITFDNIFEVVEAKEVIYFNELFNVKSPEFEFTLEELEEAYNNSDNANYKNYKKILTSIIIDIIYS